jgi:branched-subunit amino acid aminotransferase/4-amino-4-deoxychorismate lyase
MRSSVLAYDGIGWGSLTTARIPLANAQFLFGAGVFATMRCVDGKPTWWLRHSARLLAGAASLGIDAPPHEELYTIVCAGAAAIPTDLCALRLNISAASAAGVLGDHEATGMITATARPFALVPPARLACSVQQNMPTAVLPKMHKYAHYLPQMQAKRAHPMADEVLLLGSDGGVSSGSVSNLFGLTGRTLTTPHVASDARPGLARETLIAVATASGLDVVERRIDPGELAEFGELLLTNSVWGVRPVSILDHAGVSRRFDVSATCTALQSAVEAALLDSVSAGAIIALTSR